MSVPATTAVNTGPRPAPASNPCANGSEHDRTTLGIAITEVLADRRPFA
jgi:hypothetical protein